MPAESVRPLLDDEKWPSVAQACQQVPTGVEQKLPWLLALGEQQWLWECDLGPSCTSGGHLHFQFG